MNKSNELNKQSTRYILLAVIAALLAVVIVVAMTMPALADNIIVPALPPDLAPVPVGSKVFLVGHAFGTQNYICLPTSTGFAYSLFTPQATLFDGTDQIITHFFSVNPNPDDKGAIRATWQSSQDSSRIWAKTVVNGSSTNSNFVEAGAVAWLTLQVVGHLDGPAGGDKLSSTTTVQRLNTHGGLAPTTGCSSLADVGTRAFMPYTADYFFFR